jgi:hypothetical protein
LISTGLVVNGKLFNFCRENDATLSKGGLSKWFHLCEQYVKYEFIKFSSFENYSDGELKKLKDYDLITDRICEIILSNIDKNTPSKIAIEGYNFGSSAGDIVDLVTFSTLLRKKLFDLITEDIIVLSPSTLKLEACKLTYAPIDKGKKKPKLEWRNNEGISGGNFTKREMFLSIIDNENWDDVWVKHCKSIQGEILERKSVPKPYEDVNDSFILYKYIYSLSKTDKLFGGILSTK